MTLQAAPVPDTPRRQRPARIGVVSFVNALPLIDGLENLADVVLQHSVPSLLLDQVVGGEVDVGLCSSIDYQRAAVPLTIIPAGLLGCDGPTLTVRLYSTKPIQQLQRVYCDTDSHTSVALLSILLRERYHIQPELIEYNAREHVAANRPLEWPDAMMLIGDKVVTDSPPAVRYPHQLDLGDEWVRHTGLPFVFALWMARHDADTALLRSAAAVLDRQRRHNRERLDRMVHFKAKSRRWPADLAETYLKSHITYEFTAHRLKGLEMFYAKAHEHGLIPSRRELKISVPPAA